EAQRDGAVETLLDPACTVTARLFYTAHFNVHERRTDRGERLRNGVLHRHGALTVATDVEVLFVQNHRNRPLAGRGGATRRRKHFQRLGRVGMVGRRVEQFFRRRQQQQRVSDEQQVRGELAARRRRQPEQPGQVYRSVGI